MRQPNEAPNPEAVRESALRLLVRIGKGEISAMDDAPPIIGDLLELLAISEGRERRRFDQMKRYQYSTFGTLANAETKVESWVILDHSPISLWNPGTRLVVNLVEMGEET